MNQDRTAMADSTSESTLGLRLRRAREAKSLDIVAVGAKLHLPAAIIEAMEKEDLARLGAPIYIRGNYLSYARLVDVPVVAVESFCRSLHSAPQPLAPTTHVPRSRLLFDRYVKRSVYVVLTASIVPSVIWLASLERGVAPVQTLLETPAQAVTTAPRAATSATLGDSEAGTAVGGATDSQLLPVKASIAPDYSIAARPAESIEPALPPSASAPVARVKDAELVLRFVQDSWFEVHSPDGRRLDGGIAPAGGELRFPRSDVGRVSLGNAGGVDVRLDGAALDLAPFRRANVARFALSSDGSVSATDG